MRPKARLDLVEKSLREQAWTEAVVADLVKQTGRDRATIYRDRSVVLKKLAAEEASGLEERRAAFLMDLRRIQHDAKAANQYSPVMRALDLECKILGLDRVPLPTVEEDTGPVDTSLEALLRETRRMRRQAQAGHTYTAADRLLEREHLIVESIRQRDEAAAANDLTHMSEDEKVAVVTDLLANLPDTLRRKLLADLPA